MSSESKPNVLYENLNTSFVNLWALLRYLSQRSFVGRVHVEMKDYTADVFLTGSNTPLVHEVDRAAGTDLLEEAGLHRLVLRTRESPGSISVFEGAQEAIPAQGVPATPEAGTDVPIPRRRASDRGTAEVSQDDDEDDVITVTRTNDPAFGAADAVSQTAVASSSSEPVREQTPAAEEDWRAVVRGSGELIGGVEHALNGIGEDFVTLFRSVRVELADDYTFLDPTSGGFQYANSVVTLSHDLPIESYVTAVSEVLRRVVDQVATGTRARRVRERVALDLALVARKQNGAIKHSGFQSQLDRIAGTRVL